MNDSLLIKRGEKLWFLLLDRKCSPSGRSSNSSQANPALVLAQLLGGFEGGAGLVRGQANFSQAWSP